MGHPTPAQARAIANLPSATISNYHLDGKIVTEVPPNPNGGGARAAGLLDGPMEEEGWDQPDLAELKIEFEKSSDQYERVTLYGVEVLA